MKVHKLIEQLQKMPQDAEVILQDHGRNEFSNTDVTNVVTDESEGPLGKQLNGHVVVIHGSTKTSITAEVIEARMRAGWELSNRGAGWFLSHGSDQLPGLDVIQDEVVHEMVRAGVLKTHIEFTTGHAKLVETNEQ